LSFENKLRELYSFASDIFHLTPRISRIDEAALKNLIKSAGDTLQKLVKMDANIRKLLGAHSSQTTEDAVAQLKISRQ
jgi:hypothetical protein